MIYQQLKEDGTTRWVLKHKFSFAAVSMAVITMFAIRGLAISVSVEEYVLVIETWNTIAWKILGITFSLDVVDKFANNGHYHSDIVRPEPEEEIDYD